jgi:riboflavin biosynthesis pyrimidine reductase
MNPPIEPLEVLFERKGLPEVALPVSLSTLYGGTLGFRSPCLFANFVASVDGVVALATGGESGHVISGDSQADRFVMGLLRACADAVIVGATTFRSAPGHLWHPDAIYPPGAEAFAQLRRELGLRPQPTLVLVTASGTVDVTQPALHDAVVVTTPEGEERLRPRAPHSARIVSRGTDRIRLDETVVWLQEQGMKRLLTEGGPSLVAQLVAGGWLDELFVTSSPVLFGRYDADRRKSLADGLDLGGTALELLSVRRHRSHLFLRYAVARGLTTAHGP